MTAAGQEIQAILNAQRGVGDDSYIPVRLGTLRAFVAEIGARLLPPRACSAFQAPVRSAFDAGRDACVRCGLPHRAHLTNLEILAALIAGLPKVP